jgi:hypothetical protein
MILALAELPASEITTMGFSPVQVLKARNKILSAQTLPTQTLEVSEVSEAPVARTVGVSETDKPKHENFLRDY